MKSLFCLALLSASFLFCSAAESVRVGHVRVGQGKDAHDQAHADNRDLQLSKSFRAFKAPLFKNGGINSKAQCTYIPSDIESELIVDYTGNPDAISEDEIKLLESTFVETFNDVAGNLCDPTFRTIVDVQIEQSDVVASRQRQLQGSSRPARRFSFRLFVRGNCRGCSKDARLFNDAFRRLEDVKGEYEQGNRDLTPVGARFKGAFKDHRPIDLPPGSSDFFFKNPFNCDCETAPGPVSSRGIKPDEFVGAYSAKIMELNRAGTLPNVETSVGIVQVEEIACSAGLDVFMSEIIVDATGDPENITDAELNILRDLFLDSYRDTSEDVCDTQFRALTSANVEVAEKEEEGRRDLRVDRSSKPSPDAASMLNRADTVNRRTNNDDRFRSFRFRFRVSGRCKGCKSESRLFNDAFRRRLQEEVEIVVDTRMHRDLSFIVNNDTCFCAVGASKGLPEASDFSESLDAAVQTEQLATASLPNLGSISVVTQVDESMPSVTPSLTPSISPTRKPSASPSAAPSQTPSKRPSPLPSEPPSENPSPLPSTNPSQIPTLTSSSSPSNPPPSNRPSERPSRPTVPTESPIPSPSPSLSPTVTPP